MTQEEQQYLIIKGTIADLSEAERNAVMHHYETIKAMWANDAMVGLAIALIGAEACKG